jgi:2-polyprenyl-3-methyl-5-hydroxy-6-metoxy-1,4-benzoquinol methylase
MNCYLCHSVKFFQRPGSVRDNSDLNILECQNCGLVQLSSQEHLKEGHYENSGMHGSDPEPMEVWERNTAEDDQRRFEMLQAMLINQKVLDFGCGNGGFLRRATQLAAEVIGIELEDRVREHLSEKIQIFSELGALRGGSCFDLITAFHVVEHLSDPRGILCEFKKYLAPDGRIVIEVPSSSDALLTLYESEPFQHFTYWSQHLYLFNAKTLETLVQQSGLKVISIQQYQRYPLSNHLYWLSKGKPGGHKFWSFLDSPLLQQAYADTLARISQCDTLIAHLELCD